MKTERVVFLDYLRVIACFLVLLTHANEMIYLGGRGVAIASSGDAFWSTFFISLGRCCVPLFVLASSYLLFPVSGRTTSDFLKHRFARVGIPALVWLVLYAILGGGEPFSNLVRLPFNFPAPAGHLWFCYMILGLYLLMPLLTPWAEKVGKKELLCWIGLWIFTTLIPPARHLTMRLSGSPDVLSGWSVWGEANWNEFGMFYYISGYIGYLLVGLYFRKFARTLTLRRTLLVSVPLFCGGFAIAASWFYGVLPKIFPVDEQLRCAVDMEMMLRNCTVSVFMMTLAAFMCIRKIGNSCNNRIIRLLSRASYGIYLCHIFALAPLYGFWRNIFGGVDVEGLLEAGSFWSSPLVIICTAISTFVVSAIASIALGRIPKIGKYVVG